MSIYINFGRFKIFKFNLKVVYDIGAQTGTFSKYLSKLYPECKFILFEPNTGCNPFLEKTNFEYYNWLLYKKSGVSKKFYFDKNDSTSTGNSIYLEQTDHFDSKVYRVLKTKVLDDFYSKDSIDLIKLDVQGAELDILNGAKSSIQKTKFILIETSLINYNLNAPLENQIIKYMSKIGFKDFIVLDQHIWNSEDNKNLGLKRGDIFQNDLLFISKKCTKSELFRFKLLNIYIKFKNQ